MAATIAYISVNHFNPEYNTCSISLHNGHCKIYIKLSPFYIGLSYAFHSVHMSKIKIKPCLLSASKCNHNSIKILCYPDKPLHELATTHIFIIVQVQCHGSKNKVASKIKSCN